MLKKSKKIMLFLTLMICFAFFSGTNFHGLKNKINFASAESTPDLEGKSGETWSYSDDVLNLNGVDWNGQLTLGEDCTIVLAGDNEIYDEDIGISFSGTLTFSGAGSLVISVGEFGDLFACDEEEGCVIILDDGLKIYADNKTFFGSSFALEEFEELTEIEIKHDNFKQSQGRIETKQEVQAEPQAEGDEQASGESKHSHEFNYETNAGVLTAKCSSEGCDATATASLDVSDINYGENLNVTLDFSEVNNLTTLNLSLDSCTLSYYSGDSATGDAMEGVPTNAGTYTIKASFKIGESNYSLTKTFVINKIDYIGFSGEDKEVEYSGSYDVANMFTLGENAGNVTYKIVDGEDVTGSGTLNGSSLKITKCGTFQIELTVAETLNYKSLSIIKTLTVTKKSIEIDGKDTIIKFRNLTIGADNKPTYNISGLFEVKGLVSGDEESLKETYRYQLKKPKGFTDIDSTDLTFEECEKKLIKLIVEGNGCYEGAEKEINLTLVKDDVTINFSQDGWEYDGSTGTEYKCSVTIDGKAFNYENYKIDQFDNVRLSVKYYLDEAHSQDAVIPKDAGTYYVEITLSETKFTNSGMATAELKITPREVDIVWAVDEVDVGAGEQIALTYNGQNQLNKISAYYIECVNNTRVMLSVSINNTSNTSNELINRCTTSVIADFIVNDGNYILKNASNTCVVNPAKITVKVKDVHMPYGSNPTTDFSAEVISGTVYNNDNPYILVTIDDEKQILTLTNFSAINRYKISALGNDINGNYEVTSIDGTYYIENQINNLTIEDWVYESTASVPTADSIEKSENIEFKYYKGDQELEGVPTLPGTYKVKAYIKFSGDEEIYNCEATKTFRINKKMVIAPEKSQEVYVYTGNALTYKIESSVAYNVSNDTHINAGLYSVVLTLTDSDFYEWNVSDNYAERLSGNEIVYYFVIEKKVVSSPRPSKMQYKFTGKQIEFEFPKSELYSVSNLFETEVGKYTVTASLLDQKNYMWDNGSSVDVEYEFLINKTEVFDAKAVNANGETYGSTPVTITEVGGLGLDPDYELSVGVLEEKDKQLETIKNQLKSNLEKYDKIFTVYDVRLLNDGQEVQPGEFVTLKMAIPKKLENAKFRLFHIYTDENGVQTVSEVDYGGATTDGYIFVQTDKLSAFAFVYEQNSLTPLIVIFAIIDAVLAIAFAIQLAILLKGRKNKAKKSVTLASAVPVFYVATEVTASVLLGCLICVLLACNAVVLALIMKKRKTKQETKQGLDMSQIKTTNVDAQTTKKKKTKK